MRIPYTLFFILTFYCLTVVTIILDFIQQKMLKKHNLEIVEKNRAYLYIYVFKALAEIALLWLIVSFIGQIWMGWIKL